MNALGLMNVVALSIDPWYIPVASTLIIIGSLVVFYGLAVENIAIFYD